MRKRRQAGRGGGMHGVSGGGDGAGTAPPRACQPAQAGGHARTQKSPDGCPALTRDRAEAQRSGPWRLHRHGGSHDWGNWKNRTRRKERAVGVYRQTSRYDCGGESGAKCEGSAGEDVRGHASVNADAWR